MTAHEDLADALAAAATSGQTIPCHDPGRSAQWLSEAADDRTEAAQACAYCPVLDQCAEAGRTEVFGVWAGEDRGVRARRQQRLTTERTAS